MGGSRGGEGMNDREVLQALLDGKTIVDESSWHTFYYKLIKDKIYVMIGDHMWGSNNRIPELDSKYVRILEEEE